MSNVPQHLKYRSSHEWVRQETDGSVTVGITEHAQELLGDMVFIDLPDVAIQFTMGDDCAVAESVKLRRIFMHRSVVRSLRLIRLREINPN